MSRFRSTACAFALIATLLAGCDDDGRKSSRSSSARPAVAAGAAGEYVGQHQGNPASLTLSDNAGQLAGRLTVAGYPYDLSARAEGATLSGQLTDVATGGTTPFTAAVTDAGVDLTLQSAGGEMKLSLARSAPPSGQVEMGGPLGNAAAARPLDVVPLPRAQPPAPARGWTDTWNGDINGSSATLTLQRNGGDLSGQLTDARSAWTAAGTADDTSAKGQFTLAQYNLRMPFTAKLSGDAISMTITAMNGMTQELAFKRGAPPAEDESGYQRDRALVGVWRYTSMVGTKGYQSAADVYLTIAADGTYRFGDQRMVLSGPGGGFDQNSAGIAQTGRWHSKGGKVFIKPDGATKYIEWAEYSVQPNNLLFKYGNGNQQLFDRS